MEKSLPPLPAVPRRKKPPPLLLSERAVITTSRIQDSNEQLNRENQRLRQLVSRMENEREEGIRRIAELQAQNDRYREQSESQKQLVVRIANSISDAFRDYGESLQPPPSTRTREASFGYEDIISAWSDSTSSY